MHSTFTKFFFRIVICLGGFAGTIVPSETIGQVFFTEDFGFTTGVCDAGTPADGHIASSGIWSVLSVGTNETFANEWFVSASESGQPAGTCSGNSCLINASFTDRSIHIANVAGSPNSAAVCPAGDCGAFYDFGQSTALVSTHKLIASPVIDCTNKLNISLTFLYIENGDGVIDNGTVWYNDGTSWILIDDPGKTANCGSGNEWTSKTLTLPASANNNPTIQFGFQWDNDDDGFGQEASFAIDNIQLFTTLAPVADFVASDDTICTGEGIDFFDQSLNFPTSYQWTFFGGTPATSNSPSPSGIVYNNPGVYTVQLIVVNADGSDTLVGVNSVVVQACAIPIAAFSASQTTLCETNCIDFFDQSQNSPISWHWLFPGANTTSSTDQNPTNICYPVAGQYNVTLIATNVFGSDTLTVPAFITVDTCARPIVYFEASDTFFCSNTGNCINFTDLSDNVAPTFPTTYHWEFPGATPDTSDQRNPANICYDTDGFYSVLLIATNQFGSDTLVRTAYILVGYSNPAFAGPDTAIFFGESVQLQATGGDTYLWTPASTLSGDSIPNPVATPSQTTTYLCTMTDFATGCETSIPVTVTILHLDHVFVPNTFSPDGVGGGANSTVGVYATNVSKVTFTIYDRWGERVFESSRICPDFGPCNPPAGWDGTYHGRKCETGVYVYTLFIVTTGGKTHTGNGNITLIR